MKTFAAALLVAHMPVAALADVPQSIAPQNAPNAPPSLDNLKRWAESTIDAQGWATLGMRDFPGPTFGSPA